MAFKKIFNHFPTPRFLDIPYAGLSISDSAVRCIMFGKKGQNLFIEKYTEKLLEKGVIESGEIKKKEELVKILIELKKELKIDRVKVSLPEEKAYLFTAKIPIVKPSEIRGVIDAKIEENVPVLSSELVFDYKLIDHRSKGHLDVIVSALPINVIDVYIDIMDKSGLNLIALEIESQAITRTLLPENISGTVLIIHFRPGKVGLYVASFGTVHFTSTLTSKEEVSGDLEFLTQEIKKLYIYWHTLKENVDKPEKKISEVLICGESLRENIVDYLSQHIETKVVLGNPWTNAFDINLHVPEIHHDDSLRYVDAIGLALPSEFLI